MRLLFSLSFVTFLFLFSFNEIPLCLIQRQLLSVATLLSQKITKPSKDEVTFHIICIHEKGRKFSTRNNTN